MPLKLLLKSHQEIQHQNHTSPLTTSAVTHGPENFKYQIYIIIINLTDQKLYVSGDRNSAKRQTDVL